jgi:hypothetical protein
MADFELAEDFLPVYDVSDAVATAADADRETAWHALLDVDLLRLGREAPVVGMLGAKTVYDLAVRELDAHTTLLSGLMRTATTDEHARRWFRRYWTFGVGSGAHILVGALLDSARRAAEGDQDG